LRDKRLDRTTDSLRTKQTFQKLSIGEFTGCQITSGKSSGRPHMSSQRVTTACKIALAGAAEYLIRLQPEEVPDEMRQEFTSILNGLSHRAPNRNGRCHSSDNNPAATRRGQRTRRKNCQHVHDYSRWNLTLRFFVKRNVDWDA
jgi:hypothetical protein